MTLGNSLESVIFILSFPCSSSCGAPVSSLVLLGLWQTSSSSQTLIFRTPSILLELLRTLKSFCWSMLYLLIFPYKSETKFKHMYLLVPLRWQTHYMLTHIEKIFIFRNRNIHENSSLDLHFCKYLSCLAYEDSWILISASAVSCAVLFRFSPFHRFKYVVPFPSGLSFCWKLADITLREFPGMLYVIFPLFLF